MRNQGSRRGRRESLRDPQTAAKAAPWAQPQYCRLREGPARGGARAPRAAGTQRVRVARFEGLEKRAGKKPRSAEECRRQGEKPQSRRQNFAGLEREKERESTLGAGRKWEARPGGLFGAPSATRSAEEAELVERSFQSLRKVRRRCRGREKPWTLKAVRKGAVQSAPGLREGRDATP